MGRMATVWRGRIAETWLCLALLLPAASHVRNVYQPELEVELVRPPIPGEIPRRLAAGLPSLSGTVTLRELGASDAPRSCGAVQQQVTSHLPAPRSRPSGSLRGRGQREVGQCAAFAVVPHGSDTAIGSEFWGTGMFMEGAKLVLDFAFDVIGSHRLEARSAVRNLRGNSALRKLGAVREGVLRKSFLRNGEFLDQSLWTILADEWRESHMPWVSPVIH